MLLFTQNWSLFGEISNMSEKDDNDTSGDKLSPERLLSFFQGISNHATKEISDVRSIYKHTAWILGIIIVCGMYFTYKSASDFRTETRIEADRLQKQMQDRFTELSSHMTDTMNRQLIDIGHVVEKRVDSEFKQDNIKSLVENKARTRVEEIAEPMIRSTMSKNIEPQIKEANNKLDHIKLDMKDVDDKLLKLNDSSNFMNAVIRAQGDDREAFDQLKRWCDDSTFYRKGDACQARWKIVEADARSLIMKPTVTWIEGVEPAAFSFEELGKVFNNTIADHVRAGILDYIWERKDFTKKQKNEFLVDVIKKDNSLRVVSYASRLLQSESKKKFLPLLIDEVLEWWDKNKDTINR